MCEPETIAPPSACSTALVRWHLRTNVHCSSEYCTEVLAEASYLLVSAGGYSRENAVVLDIYPSHQFPLSPDGSWVMTQLVTGRLQSGV